MTRALHLAFVAKLDSHKPPTRAHVSILSRMVRFVRRLIAIPRTPQAIRNALTEMRHMRTLAELRDLDQRKDALRKEINAAHRELMRLSGKEAMTRHKLRMM